MAARSLPARVELLLRPPARRPARGLLAAVVILAVVAAMAPVLFGRSLHEWWEAAGAGPGWLRP
jgi:hypothetical protein